MLLTVRCSTCYSVASEARVEHDYDTHIQFLRHLLTSVRHIRDEEHRYWRFTCAILAFARDVTLLCYSWLQQPHFVGAGFNH